MSYEGDDGIETTETDETVESGNEDSEVYVGDTSVSNEVGATESSEAESEVEDSNTVTENAETETDIGSVQEKGTETVSSGLTNSEDSNKEIGSAPEEKTAEEKAEDTEKAENTTEAGTETDEAVRAEIAEKSEYSDEVNQYISSVEELEIYQNAGLHEQVIEGRVCLVKEDIDPNYVDEKTGLTNAELMAKGRAPYDAKTGERIELHHIGQDYSSPLAELTENTEHGGNNHGVLHTKESESWRSDSTLNNHYNNVERPSHWKARA